MLHSCPKCYGNPRLVKVSDNQLYFRYRCPVCRYTIKQRKRQPKKEQTK